MPRTSRPLEVFPIILRGAEVTAIEDVTVNMRRLTLAGPDLLGGDVDGTTRPAFTSRGFDDHVKLVIPFPDDRLPHIGTQQEYRFEWNPEVFAHTRDYTVRTWDEAEQSFTIDVVRHRGGLASEWAYRAQVGQSLHFAGPKTSAGITPDVDFHLLIGDETALPAIGRWLAEAAAGTRARIIVETPTAADTQEIDTAAEVQVDWLVREDVPAGWSTLLHDALQEIELPAGRTFAWCAGEAMTLVPIRRHLRGELGLPREDVEVVGYWRRPADPPVPTPHTRPHAEAPAASASHAEAPAGETDRRAVVSAVHEMTELAPPIVTRVAVTLGIGPHIAAGVTGRAALAEATGTAQERLDVLLDAMLALGLLREDDDGSLSNSPLGGVLLDDDAIAGLTLDDPVNRDALALVGLLDVLRTGTPATDVRAARRASAEIDSAHDSAAADLVAYGIDPLTELAPVAQASTLLAAGDGLAELARGLHRRRPDLGIRLVVEPHRHDRLAAAVADIPVTVHRDPGESVSGNGETVTGDCMVLVSALAGLSDAEALAALTAARRAADTLVVLEATGDGAKTDDHVAEDALIALAGTGRGLRTSEQLRELAVQAGWSQATVSRLGWGFATYRSAVLACA